MNLTYKEIQQLIAVALETREFAFSHRSNHKIGASVLTAEGKIFGGCNIESVISGLGACAERVAVDHAISHGHYNFRAICTVDTGLTPTCGACLQYLLLFSQLSDTEIYMVNADTHGHYEVIGLNVLLPHGYRTIHHLNRIRRYGMGKRQKDKSKRSIKKFK